MGSPAPTLFDEDAEDSGSEGFLSSLDTSGPGDFVREVELRAREEVAEEDIKLAPDGIYTDVPEQYYHAHPALSRSVLAEAAYYSLAHAKEKWEAGDVEPTSAMQTGSAVHEYILEPSRYEERVVMPPQCEAITGSGDQCTNAPKAWYPDETGELGEGLWYCGTHARHAGTEPSEDVRPVKESDHELAGRIREEIRAHDPDRSRPLEDILYEGRWETEVTLLWTDPNTGLRLRARPDLISEVEGEIYMVDLKTSGSAHSADFRRKFEKFGYWLQPPFYQEGFAACTGGALPDQWLFVVCETDPPYAVKPYYPKSEQLQWYKDRLRRLLTSFLEALDYEEWDAYGAEAEPIGLKKYQLRRLGIEMT